MSRDPETPAPLAAEAADALRRRESELRALVDTVPDIVFQVDRDLRLVAANEHFTQATIASQGMPIALGEPVLAPRYPEEFTGMWRDFYDRAFAGESFAVETSSPRADEVHYLENYLGPVRQSDGEIIGVVVTSRDITEHRRLQLELDDERQRHKLVVEHSSEAILQFELDGRLLSANPAACRMFGCVEDRLREIGRDGILDPGDRRFQEALAVSDLTGDYSGELRFARADGSSFPGEASTTVYTDHHGAERTSMIIRDITRRKASEAALRASEAMRDVAERVARVGSWHWDVATRVSTWSDGMYRLFDVDPGQPIGDVTPILDARVHPDDRAAVDEATAAVVGGQPAPVEYRVIWRDGSEHVLHGEGALERDADGAVTEMNGYYQDVTEQRLVEQKILRLNDQLEEKVLTRTAQLDGVNQELESYAYAVSHTTCAPPCARSTGSAPLCSRTRAPG